METESTQDILLVYQNDFDKSIHDFEKFAREVFNGSNENEKTKLHKKLEEFMTFKDHYKKKHDSEKLENILTQSRKRQIVSPAHLNSKKKKLDPLKLFELPNEIWLKIMSYLKTSDILKRFNLVCKHFNSLSLDSSAIKHIEFKEIENRECYHQAVSALKRCKTLHEVDIYKCSYVTNLVSQTMRSAHGLRKLKLQSIPLSGKAFKNIQIWQGLQSLELIGMDFTENETILLEIAKIKTLKSLMMKDCMIRIDTDVIDSLAENCKNFQELNIDFVQNVDVQEISKLKALKSFKFSKGSLDAKQIQALIKCDRLESVSIILFDNDMARIESELNAFFLNHRLSLKKLKIGTLKRTMQNHILKNLVLCENLEEIAAISVSNFCNSDLARLFQLPKLKRLAVNHLNNFSRELRRTIVTNNLMANLEEFEGTCDIFRTSDPQLIFQMPKITTLKLHRDPWVLSKTKRLVLKQMNCPLLSRLILTGFKSENPFNLNALRSILKQFPDLRSVQIIGHVDKELRYDHLYQISKECGIFLGFGLGINGNDFQCKMEDAFQVMDEEFYLKYQEKKKKYFEWLEHNDWPTSWSY